MQAFNLITEAVDAKELVGVLLEAYDEEEPEDWHGELWRDPADLEDKIERDNEETAALLPDRNLTPEEEKAMPSGDDYARRSRERMWSFQVKHQQGLAVLAQVAPSLKWTAGPDYDDDDYHEDEGGLPPAATHYHGETKIMAARVRGGPNDGDVIDPTLVVQICVPFGVEVRTVLPPRANRSTMRARLALYGQAGDLAGALMAKNKDAWMSRVKHNLKITLTAADDDYYIGTDFLVDDPQMRAKAVMCQRIVKQVAAQFARVWIGARNVRAQAETLADALLENKWNPKGLRRNHRGELLDKWGRVMDVNWPEFEKKRRAAGEKQLRYPKVLNPLHAAAMPITRRNA